MKLHLIEGVARVLLCAGCGRHGIGGTESYVNESRGETVVPEEWYTPEGPGPEVVWCAPCAAKIVQEDLTRAVHQFFSDTAGNEIEPEIIQES